MSEYLGTQLERIKNALALLGFDGSDYTDMLNSVLLTPTGKQKAEAKHFEIKKAGLQYFEGGSIGIAQPKSKIRIGYRKVKTLKPKKPKKVH